MTDKKAARKGAAKAGAKKAGAAKKTSAKKTSAKKTGAAKASAGKPRVEKAGKPRVEKVDGGRYVLIDGRRWRATDPSIPEAERQRLVNELMRARRDVGVALRAGDERAEGEARERVHRAKVALGERGEKWWEREAEKKKTSRKRGKK